MGSSADTQAGELVRENVSGSPFDTAAPAAEQVAPPKRRPGRPRKAQPAKPAPEPQTPAEALIAETPPPLAPRATTKDAKEIEAAGQTLAVHARGAGETLSKVSPLAGTVLAERAEQGSAALARVVGRFAPGLLKAGSGTMIVFDLAHVLSSLVALGVAALVDARRLPADHPAAQRLGVTEVAARLAERQALHAQQLARAAAGGLPANLPLDPAQYAYMQNQLSYQLQVQQQQHAQAAAQAYAAEQMAQARAAAAAYNAGAGLYPAFAAGG